MSSRGPTRNSRVRRAIDPLNGVPHIVLDQSCGKLRPVFEEYSGAFSSGHFAASAEVAIEMAGSMRST